MSGVWRGSAARWMTTSLPWNAGVMASRSVRSAVSESSPSRGTRSMPLNSYLSAEPVAQDLADSAAEAGYYDFLLVCHGVLLVRWSV